MYIRRVRTRTTADGSRYYSFRLVENYRVGKRVRQRTLLNLGSQFDFPREQWPELTQRIEQILVGQDDMLVTFSDELEQQAQSTVNLLLKKYSQAELLAISGVTEEKQSADKVKSGIDGKDLQAVDLNSMEHSNSRTVGGEALAHNALLEARLPEYLESLKFNSSQVHAAMGNIVGRMLQPGSELSTHEWLQKQSGLGDLLNFEFEKQGLSALYRVSDLLWENHKKIEDYLYQQHIAMFDIEECITFYDLTNTFLEGSGKYNELAEFGLSKERRSDCPLVTLALVLDGSGFSRRSRIYPGNISEPTTLQQMIEQLAFTTRPYSRRAQKQWDRPQSVAGSTTRPHHYHGCRNRFRRKHSVAPGSRLQIHRCQP